MKPVIQKKFLKVELPGPATDGYGTHVFKHDSEVWFTVVLQPSTVRLCILNLETQETELVKGIAGLLRAVIPAGDGLFYLLTTQGIQEFSYTEKKFLKTQKKGIPKYAHYLVPVNVHTVAIMQKQSQSVTLFSVDTWQVLTRKRIPVFEAFLQNDQVITAFSLYWGVLMKLSQDLQVEKKQAIPPGRSAVVADQTVYYVKAKSHYAKDFSGAELVALQNQNKYPSETLEQLISINSKGEILKESSKISGLSHLLGIDNGSGLIVGLANHGVSSTLIFIDQETFKEIERQPISAALGSTVFTSESSLMFLYSDGMGLNYYLIGWDNRKK